MLNNYCVSCDIENEAGAFTVNQMVKRLIQ